MTTPMLSTRRLLLRPFRKEDAADAYRLLFHPPRVAKYMFWARHTELRQSEEWVADELSSVSDADWYSFAVVRREDNQLIGMVSLYCDGEDRDWELAYCFGRGVWNRGYATEAVGRILSFGKDELRLERIVARFALENKASGRVLEKLGFRYERDVDYVSGNGAVVLPGALYSV